MAGLFDPILNWRLLPGSHAFPGPDGGTCINEAAVVAAGLPYRAIRSSADCPPCFSAPLATYALGLNDAMPDAERPRLMAFVLRLAGSADAPPSRRRASPISSPRACAACCRRCWSGPGCRSTPSPADPPRTSPAR